jgi:hypothetical protein
MIVATSFKEAMTFKVDLKHQFKSLKYCRLIGILLIIIPTAIYALGWWPVFDFNFLGVILLALFIFLLPAFYLHITYYIQNKNALFRITDNSQYFYSDKERELQFKLKDIDVIEQHIGIYHENNIDFANRRTAPWTNYHYIKIQLRNGEHFFLTSLMIDYKSFPMHIYTTKFRYIPYLK